MHQWDRKSRSKIAGAGVVDLSRYGTEGSKENEILGNFRWRRGQIQKRGILAICTDKIHDKIQCLEQVPSDSISLHILTVGSVLSTSQSCYV